jgi:hypothetical protein
MHKVFRRLLLKACLYIGLPCAAFIALYGWWMKSRLEAQVVGPQALGAYSTTQYRLVDAKTAGRDTSWPRVVRLAVRGKDGSNWRATPAGLVFGIYDWIPGHSEWAEVPATLEEEAAAAKLRARVAAAMTPGGFIDLLADPDAHIREAAHACLRASTRQDFGYRHDRDPGTQKEAIGKWRTWWDANKLTWAVEGALEIFKGMEAGSAKAK